MQLSLVNDTVTATEDRVSMIRNVLRVELSARRVAVRRWLIERTGLVLHDVKREETEAALAELVDAEDITEGSHGRVAAAPSWLVDVGDGRLLLVGSLATEVWRRHLDLVIDDGMLPRRLTTLDEAERSRITQAALQIGIATISAEAWSGIVNAPTADEAWLNGLNERLKTSATEVPSSDDESPWQAWTRSGDAPGQWRRSDNAKGELWRRFSYGSFFEHAWTSGESPAQGGWLRLTRDESSRARFAIDRRHGGVKVELAEGRTGGISLQIRNLPWAEYRWLCTVAVRSRSDGTFEISGSQRLHILTRLTERLGIQWSVVKDLEVSDGRNP